MNNADSRNVDSRFGFNNQIKVITRYNDSTIEQEVEGEVLGVSSIARRIVNLQDEGIRKALIAIGWTPPNPE